MRLKGRVAIVTGAGSGLGKAIAERCASEGASIVIADMNQGAVDATVKELQAAGHQAMGFKVNVTSRAQLKELMQATEDKFGKIDILVNSAGITRNRPFKEMNDEDWDIVLGVDLKGTFFAVQAVADYMIKHRYGKVLNISSLGGLGVGGHAVGGSPGGSSNYQAAKAGVIQLTKTLARELGPHGINVNSVAPGFILTPMTSTTRTPEEVKEHMAVRTKTCVLNRAGTPQDIANAVLFLVSEESSFISGQTLLVDGGRTDKI
jgi:NAD(P)-dependent dehydrogenase (short-subunit alcohol dehydrogenase family)